MPVANSNSVSLVEVSPSTVIALKEFAAASASIGCKTAFGSAASVKTKASNVAMSGAIIPDPFAIPFIVTR